MDADLDNEIIEISDTESVENNLSMPGHKRKRSHCSSNSDSSSSSEGVVWLDEESESETEVDCEYWDQDCVVLEKYKFKNVLYGFHLMPTCMLKPDELTIVEHVPELNVSLQNTSTILNLQTNWENHNAFNDGGVEIITEPWRACVVTDFLQNAAILNDIRQDYDEINWHRRTLDLYEFFQSDDLDKLTIQNIRKMYDFICGDLKSWVATITGTELSEVSATCSFYSETDFLLVHDDQRGNRAVAFVIYITGDDGWQSDWGGALQLLSRDDAGQPSLKSVRHIYPKNNQLILFPVTDHSFHQVLEVTRPTAYPRLSINGWFHTPTSTIYDSPVHTPATTGGLRCAQYTRPQYSVPVELRDWVMAPYLELRTAMQVQAYMEDSSEISLDGYVEKTTFGDVWRQISRQDLKWEPQGPLNRRNYSTLVEKGLPQKIVDFINIFKSGEFFKLLQEYTAVDFDHMRYEVQRWEQGNYDLLGNRPEASKGMRLDVILYLCHDYDNQNDLKNTSKQVMRPTNDTENKTTSTNEAISKKDSIAASNIKDKLQDITTPDSTILSNDNNLNCKINSTEQPINSSDSKKLSTNGDTMIKTQVKCESVIGLCDDDVDMFNSSSNNATDLCPSTSTNKDGIKNSISSDDKIDSYSYQFTETVKLNKPMQHDIIGGKLMYVDIKEKVQNALVTIVPNNNTINFVYGDTAYFTSYLSKKNPADGYFYVMFASYYEEQSNEQEYENPNISSDSD